MRPLVVLSVLVPALSFAQTTGVDAALLDAAREGDADGVRAALDAGADLEAADAHGATALLWSAHAGSVDAVRVLDQAGARLDPEGVIWADENQTGYYGSPLAAAAGRGHADVVTALAEAGALLEQPEWSPQAGDRTGWTASQWAAWEGHVHVVATLVELGGRPLWQWHDPDALTPVQLAIANRQMATVVLFSAFEAQWQNLHHINAGRLALSESQRSHIRRAWDGSGLGRLTQVLDGKGGGILSALERADSLANAAVVSYEEGRYGEANAQALEALSTREAALGSRHVAVANGMGLLATQLRFTGESGEARRLYKQSLSIRRSILGPRHPDVSLGMNNLAGLLREQGGFEAARSLYEQALEITQVARGPAHPSTAKAISNLAGTLEDMGEYVNARPLYERARSILERDPDADPLLLATILNNLANFLQLQGDLTSARPLFERALLLRSSRLPTDHPLVAQSMNNLGILLRDQQDVEAARPLLEGALHIREAALPPRSLDLADSQTQVALLAEALGDPARALHLHERALENMRTSLPPVHPDIARGLNNVGSMLHQQGEYATAREHLEQAVEINEAARGDGHPSTAWYLNNLGNLRADQQRYRSARDAYIRASEILNAFITSVLPALSPPEQEQFIREYLTAQQSTLLSTATWTGATETKRTYALLAGWKGLLLDGLRRESTLIRLAAVHPDDTVRTTVDDLKRLRSLVKRAYVREEDAGRLASELEAAQRRLYSVLPNEVDDRWSATERNASQQRPGATALDALQTSLRSGEAFVDVYLYYRLSGAGEAGSIRYAAVLLPAGADAAPLTFVDLGLARTVDLRLTEWQRAVAVGEAAEDEADSLRTALWDPIRSALSPSVGRVWVSPDGLLSRLPWNWLAAEDDHLLVSHTPSARALLQSLAVEPPTALAGERGRLLAAGAVAYGAAPGTGAAQPFAPLSDSGPEADSVAALAASAGLHTEMVTGRAPTAERLRSRLRGARYVHLATHGYYGAPTPADTTASSPTRSAFALAPDDPAVSAVRTAVASRNPLLESGIALAGANESSEGLLTAAELATFDLRGVRLLTLSACETGLGREVSGQGVLGLRAAALAAGAEATLVALWDVPDDVTAELMGRFYRGLWEEGLEPVEALRAAQNELRAADLPPKLWAAWVLDGGR